MKAKDIYNAAAKKIYAAYRLILVVLGILFIFFFAGIFIFSQGALFMIVCSSIVGLILLGFLIVQHQQLHRLEVFLKKTLKKDKAEFNALENLFISEDCWLYWDNRKGKSGTFDQLRQCSVIEGTGKSIFGSQYPVYKLSLHTVKDETVEVIVRDRKKVDQTVAWLMTKNPEMINGTEPVSHSEQG